MNVLDDNYNEKEFKCDRCQEMKPTIEATRFNIDMFVFHCFATQIEPVSKCLCLKCATYRWIDIKHTLNDIKQKQEDKIKDNMFKVYVDYYKNNYDDVQAKNKIQELNKLIDIMKQ